MTSSFSELGETSSGLPLALGGCVPPSVSPLRPSNPQSTWSHSPNHLIHYSFFKPAKNCLNRFICLNLCLFWNCYASWQSGDDALILIHAFWPLGSAAINSFGIRKNAKIPRKGSFKRLKILQNLSCCHCCYVILAWMRTSKIGECIQVRCLTFSDTRFYKHITFVTKKVFRLNTQNYSCVGFPFTTFS